MNHECIVYAGPRDILVQLNREVTTLREGIESRREKYRKLERHYCAVKKENKALKMKLREAAKDIRRLMEDREKLMDISNAMKANMTRLGTDSLVQASSDDSEGVLSQKVKELAMITEELKTENRMLRVQLDRWPGEKSPWNEHERAKKEATTIDHDDMDDILYEELPTKRKSM
jgi:chromosome segregation ATPase